MSSRPKGRFRHDDEDRIPARVAGSIVSVVSVKNDFNQTETKDSEQWLQDWIYINRHI